MVNETTGHNTLATYAAAAIQTRKIRLGTSIMPIYGQHPLTLARQVLTVNEIAPQRLRLGVGPSHRSIVEGIYGLEMKQPLEHLREYLARVACSDEPVLLSSEQVARMPPLCPGSWCLPCWMWLSVGITASRSLLRS
ncbi:LLM class flavin-dependent oxidoreductase [Ktedonobacter sp. SOSP1-85]|uniref:LLM class flavin-dependent oxidoreductase n=1 Tax=Ktedonobacter sp. SOSP1-85 TaxID=2778367 RepID=UPI0019152D60|nr:LLM class flavin-dependent oxidoreductase [Ktedonobacter sp. SOSP1-85]